MNKRPIFYTLFILVSILLAVASCSSKKDAQAYLAKAKQYESEHKYQAAIIELKNLLQNDSQNTQARTLLATIYITIGDGVSAEKELNKAISLGVDKDNVIKDLVRALLLQGKHDEAIQQITINDSWPADKRSDMLLLQGNAYLTKDEYANAKNSFQKALALNASNSAATIGLAKLAYIDDKPEQAEKLLASIGSGDPNVSDALLLKARYAQSQQRLDKAQDLYQQALKISQARNLENASLYIQSQLAMVQIKDHKLDEALQNVNQVLNTAPNFVIAIYARGLIAYLQKDYDKAIEYLQRVISAAPDHMPTTLLLGAIQFAKGNYEQSNNFLTKFVSEVPTHIQARKLLGYVRLRLHKPDEAMEILKSGTDSLQKDDAQLLAIIGEAASVGGDTQLGVDYLQRAKKIQPNNSGIRAELAKVYLSQGTYDKAIQELETISGNANENEQAKRLLIYTYLRKQDFSEARKTTQALIKDSPDNPAWWVVLGGVELIAGNRDEARKNLNKALSIRANFAPARLNLARLELEDGQLLNASHQFETVLEAEPKNGAALLGMAQIAEKSGDTKQALDWLEKARQSDKDAIVPRLVLGRYYLRNEKYDQALVIAKEAFAADGNNIQVLRMLALTYIKLKQEDEALNTYQRVAKKDPKNPQWQYEIGNIYSGSKRFEQARLSYNKALQLNKEFLPAMVNLAGVDIQQGKFDNALKKSEQIKNQFPKSSAGFMVAGDVYVQEKKMQQAQKEYIAGFNLEPSLVFVNKIFLASGALNDYTKSVEVSNQWLTTHPDDLTAHMYLGLAYQYLNQSDKAEQAFEKVLESDPKNVMALNNLAFLLINSNNKRALQYADQARQLAPNNFAVMDTYGWVLTVGGDARQGAEVLQNALAKSDDNPSVTYHYAYALQKNNDTSKAVALLEKIVQSQVSFPEQADAKKLLQTIK